MVGFVRFRRGDRPRHDERNGVDSSISSRPFGATVNWYRQVLEAPGCSSSCSDRGWGTPVRALEVSAAPGSSSRGSSGRSSRRAPARPEVE